MMMVELIRGGIPSGLKDPFWERTSGYLGSGLIACVAEHEDPAKRNLTTIFSKYLSATDFDYTLAAELDGGKVKPLAYQAIAAYLNLPERETRPSVKGHVHFQCRLPCLCCGRKSDSKDHLRPRCLPPRRPHDHLHRHATRQTLRATPVFKAPPRYVNEHHRYPDQHPGAKDLLLRG